jgi:CBS domain-containing protein
MKIREISDIQSVIDQLHSFYLFNHVDKARLGVMIEKAQLVSLDKDEFIFKRGESYHRGVYVILGGRAELYSNDGSIINMVYGDVLGLTTFLGKSNYYVTAKSDGECELVFLPEICIYKLMEEFEDFRNKYNKMTFDRLSKVSGGSPANLTENTYKSVGGCMTTPVISVDRSASIFEASGLMAEHKVGSVVVVDEKGMLAGLLTSKQLVHKYMANPERTSLPCEVKEYMNAAPVNMPPEFPIVEAIAELQIQSEDYAIVVKGDKPVGLISNNDLMSLVFQNSNIYNSHINGMTTLDQLREAHRKLFDIAKTLVANSRLTSSILPVLSSVHINIQRKAYQITLENTPVDILETMQRVRNSMIIMGSGGRKEMMLDPDQDHAYILANDATAEDKKQFVRFGEIFADNLEYVGYEKCRGNIMASNPDMVKTLHEWRRVISEWINNPGSEGFLWSSVFFDMDRFEGDEKLVWDLKEFISIEVPQRPVFLIQLLERDVNTKQPTTFFGRINLEKDGEKKGTINLKTSALQFLVDVTRAYTLKTGLSDLNTLERAKHLERKKVLAPETVSDFLGSYETIVDLLLKEQISKVEQGGEANKNIDPSQLSLYNQERLKSSLQFITKYLNKALKTIKMG